MAMALFDEHGRPIKVVGNDTTELFDENGRPVVVIAGGGDPLKFIDLDDTPSGYSGNAGKAVKVNSGEDGLEFAAPCTRSGTLKVAASNATDTEKAQADYVCDGIDDDVEIQAALDALQTAGGGTLELSSGDFTIEDTLIIPPVSHRVMGQGEFATGLFLANGVNASMWEYTASIDTLFITFERMSMDGNKANNTAGSGIYINPGDSKHVWDMTFRDLFIYSFAENGIWSMDAHDYVLDHVIVEYCGSNATPWVAAVFLGGENPFLSNCLIKLNDGRGLYLSMTASMVNTVIRENYAVGLYIGGHRNRIVGCIFDNNSLGANDTYDHLDIDGNNNIISACTFYGTDVKYCVHITGDNQIILGNDFIGYATAALLDSGSGSIIEHNRGIS
jgi:hypothetical protein